MKKVDGLAQAFGSVLAEERGKKNISQEQLAEMIDSNNVYVCLLENGQRQPSLNAMILLAKALEISPTEFMQRVFDKLPD